MSFLLIAFGVVLVCVSMYVSLRHGPNKERLSLELWGCGALLVLLGSALYIWNY